ncbi:papain-like cysteine protease family protein [Clostridium sp. JS66]|uniref:papain-like cysteine protease family protein n=1 Tax=Clostridium sp. JS66 TaxID=3064705 RepID=UPI00298EBB6B|nr:papain-like cysteine protease family protein [Clostridium sp. JS66]WPC42690.1 papain-like cysteine protease family protein [Clostridium sp. JS66]
MKKRFKSLIFILILVLIMSTQFLGQPVKADELISKTNTTEFIQSSKIPENIINFAKDKFETLSQGVKDNPYLYELNSDEANNLCLGQGFNIFNLEDNKTSNIYYFPVLSDKKIKEILTVSLNDDGTYSATLGKDFAQKLENVSMKSTTENPLLLLSYKELIVAKNKNGITKLNNLSINKNSSFNEDTLNRIINSKEIAKTSTNIVNVKKVLPTTHKKVSHSSNLLGASNTNSGRYLSVPITTQRTSDGVQHGMCWAASVSCIVNYKLNKNITAANVCDLMNVGYDDGANGIVARNALGIYGISAFAVDNPLSFDQVVNYINNNKPVYMRSTSNIGNHATVINGWIKYSDGNSLILMDPAYECYKQAYSSGNTFSFGFGNTIMTWYASVFLL